MTVTEWIVSVNAGFSTAIMGYIGVKAWLNERDARKRMRALEAREMELHGMRLDAAGMVRQAAKLLNVTPAKPKKEDASA